MSHRTAAEGHRVLIVAPFGRDAESMAALLTREHYDAHVCETLDAAVKRIDEHLGAILFTEEALASGAGTLGAALEAQPHWSDVPLLLLANRPQRETARADHLRDHLPDAATNVVVLERPLGSVSLLSALRSAMRSRQKQFEMRDRVAELAASESRLRLATAAAQIGTWDYDPLTDTLRWDDRCRGVFGLRSDDPVTYTGAFLAGIHPDDRAAADAAVQRALTPGGDPRYAIEYRTIGPHDGVERWVAARGSAVFEGGRAIRFIGTVIDISEAKRAQAALAASEAALREESRALETLNVIGRNVAAERDLDTIVQQVVDAGVTLTGARFGAFFYTRVDETGESYTLYAISGADPAAFAGFPMPRNTALFAPTFAGRHAVRSGDIATHPHYGKSDPHRGMPKGHLAVRSYLAVPVLARSGEVHGTLFFGHPDPDIFSERAQWLAEGLAAQAAIGIDNARLLAEAQRVNQTLEEKVIERTAALDAEMESRARAEAALRQSQKMEAVGQLTGGIAHDFNNMLTGVIGGIDIARRRIAGGRYDDVGRFMDAASTSAQRAAALTQRLLAFARRQSLDSRPIDVNALVAALDSLLRQTVHEQVALQVVLAEDLPPAIADGNQLESAILNLAINARDAMPEGGQLTVETSFAELDATAVANRPEFKPGRYVMVAVSDTGVGMSPEVLEKVFEPFFTTKPIGQGTGLGLSMVYGFARQSGGQVRIHSREGQGTSVKLYLPAATGALAEETSSVVAPASGAGQTVLLVEDEESVRLLVRDVLTELGYQAIEAADANAAIKILGSDAELDLMISDVGLPGMNGRQLAEVARRHRAELPILFVTGYAENAAIRADFLGANMAMVTKPFAIDTLAAKIGDMLGAAAAS